MSKYRKIYLVILDAVLINIAAVAALYLRFELRVPSRYLYEYSRACPYFTVISLAIFAMLGLYSVILRYASVDQLFGFCFRKRFEFRGTLDIVKVLDCTCISAICLDYHRNAGIFIFGRVKGFGQVVQQSLEWFLRCCERPGRTGN